MFSHTKKKLNGFSNCYVAMVVFQNELPVSMETDSTMEEEEEQEGADEDGHEGSSPSPGGEDAVQGRSGAAPPYSAPCSPSGSRPGHSPVSDRPSTCKTSKRSSPLSPSSPLALRQNDCVCDSAFCPADHGPPGMQRNTGTG